MIDSIVPYLTSAYVVTLPIVVWVVVEEPQTLKIALGHGCGGGSRRQTRSHGSRRWWLLVLELI